jgi:hypothetical protein
MCQGAPLTEGCVNGQCTCNAGLTRCGTACVNTGFDRNNCGACGVVCAPNLTCINGACTTP